jgi:hypothetical protein
MGESTPGATGRSTVTASMGTLLKSGADGRAPTLVRDAILPEGYGRLAKNDAHGMLSGFCSPTTS